MRYIVPVSLNNITMIVLEQNVVQVPWRHIHTVISYIHLDEYLSIYRFKDREPIDYYNRLYILMDIKFPL